MAAHDAIRCQVELQRRSGGNANIGRELYPLVTRAGFDAVRVSPRMVYVDASRPRLVAQLVTESLVLATVAAVAGVLLCRGLLYAFDAYYPNAGAPVSRAASDPAVLGFALVVAVLGALGFAVWPAWRASGRASA